MACSYTEPMADHSDSENSNMPGGRMTPTEPQDPPDEQEQPVAVREDFVPSMQCPCCNMFFGLYVATPLNAPDLKPQIATVPPDKVNDVHEELLERWRQRGTLSREKGDVVGVDPKSTN